MDDNNYYDGMRNALAPAKPVRQEPAVRLDDPNFVWIPSYLTDVQRTWRKFGWKPISESKDNK